MANSRTAHYLILNVDTRIISSRQRQYQQRQDDTLSPFVLVATLSFPCICLNGASLIAVLPFASHTHTVPSHDSPDAALRPLALVVTLVTRAFDGRITVQSHTAISRVFNKIHHRYRCLMAFRSNALPHIMNSSALKHRCYPSVRPRNIPNYHCGI